MLTTLLLSMNSISVWPKDLVVVIFDVESLSVRGRISRNFLNNWMRNEKVFIWTWSPNRRWGALMVSYFDLMHEVTVTRVSPNQLTPATELCVTALWAQQRAAVRSINNISRGGYITLEVLNILSNLFNFLMAKLLKRSSYTAIRSISIVVRVVRNNLQGSHILHMI